MPNNLHISLRSPTSMPGSLLTAPIGSEVPAYARPAAAPAAKVAVKGFDPEAFLATAGAGRLVIKYAPGEEIFRQGDPADAVFYVQKGNIQVKIVSSKGKEGVIAMLDAGNFVGEGCLAGQEEHIATAAAATECTVIKIEKQAMIRALRDEPALSHRFMSFLLSRNVQAEADLVDHLFNSCEKRLARVLLLLADVGKQRTTATIPNINQEILAGRVGTTRSRINMFMNKFRKLGFIEYDGGSLKIHSVLQNVIAHDLA